MLALNEDQILESVRKAEQKKRRVTRNTKNKETIQHIFPYYDFEEFKQAKRQIDRIVAKTLPEKLKQLRKTWKGLSTKQKTALRLKYDEELSHADAAARVNITVDSFRNRLEGAERRLEKDFPDLKRREEATVEVKTVIELIIHYNLKANSA